MSIVFLKINLIASILFSFLSKQEPSLFFYRFVILDLIGDPFLTCHSLLNPEGVVQTKAGSQFSFRCHSCPSIRQDKIQ